MDLRDRGFASRLPRCCSTAAPSPALLKNRTIDPRSHLMRLTINVCRCTPVEAVANDFVVPTLGVPGSAGLRV